MKKRMREMMEERGIRDGNGGQEKSEDGKEGRGGGVDGDQGEKFIGKEKDNGKKKGECEGRRRERRE